METRYIGIVTYGVDMNDRIWDDWPRCSRCQRRRQTVCPVCGVAGNQFLLAEYLVPAEPMRGSRRPAAGSEGMAPPGSEILLLCPQCEEAFAPQFYRNCPECGQDAGQGIEIRRWMPEPLSHRLLLALGGLLLIGLLCGIYFQFLFRNG